VDGRRVQYGFNGQLLAELLVAELAAEGVLAELPASCWTARGDRFLDTNWLNLWREPAASLGNTGLVLDECSPFQFPDDEFGIGETVPHEHAERELVQKRLLAAIEVLRNSCAHALNLVTALVEVLALRRELTDAKAFYSSTFWGYAGLVRFANSHLPEADTAALTEALVHEATHCLLHVHEELDGPFLRVDEAKHTTLESPWTGNKIQLISYVHACAVWYGLYWLWSTIGSKGGVPEAQAETLKRRAHSGFQYRPVSVGLVGFDHLLTESIRVFLRELEQRMLSLR
jgi:hypothetical protein